MKNRLICLAFVVALTTSCNLDPGKPKNAVKRRAIDPNEVAARKHGQPYLRSGLYYLANPGGGVPMKLESSAPSPEDTVTHYRINPDPIVSVHEIAEVDAIQDYDGTPVLRMQFNEPATRAFAKATGNPTTKFIALVIANKLYLVAEVHGKITTGLVSVTLPGKSREDIFALREAILQGK